jgi:glycosyltransferase involved in cell wall biosynthesis
MRILQVTLGFYPALSWGGPVRVVHQNSRELIRRGHSVTVYCTNLLDRKRKMGRRTTETKMDGMRVVYFNTIRFPWWPGTLGPFWLPDLRGYLRREIDSFDLVHLNGYRSPMLLAIAHAARVSGIPIVTQPHGTLPVMISSFFLKRLYDNLLGYKELEGISALIALQETERNQARELGISDARIEIIPNGISPDELNGLPAKGHFKRHSHLDPGKSLIIFIGRLNRIKGVDMLVEAFGRLDYEGAQLAIAGPDGGQLAAIRESIARLSPQKRSCVFLFGPLTGTEVLSALRDADIFVLPSRSDAFPFIIIEACLVGTPMVITDRCQIADSLKGRIAEVTPFDSGEFSLAMERLLKDHELRGRYRQNCQNYFKDSFSLPVVVDRLETVYGRVVAEQSGRRDPLMS